MMTIQSLFLPTAAARGCRMAGMRALCLLVPLCLAAAACSGDDDGSSGQDPGDSSGSADDGDDSSAGDDSSGGDAPVLEHEFPSIGVESGQEITTMCLSWSLHNEDPLFVSTVAMNAGPGWHHSNWFYVPSGTFPADDGVWNCEDGEFDQVAAALAGGVLFAQSTQATDETQSFPEGAVLEVPRDAVVVSQIHLLNASDEAIDTGVSMKLSTVKEEDVQIRLHPMSFDFHQLAIPPQQRSRFEAECDMVTAGGPLDATSLYYALPHYHKWARGMNIEMFGGDREGEVISDVEARIGEPLGTTLSPPLSMAGAQGIRFGCTYDNDTDRTIGYGNSGDDEMCIFLAFTDSDLTWAGGVVTGEATMTGMDGDVAVYTGECTTIAVPSPTP
jgi:hypothetical protein